MTVIAMKILSRMLIGIVAMGLLCVFPSGAQPTGAPADSTTPWHDDAWTPIVKQNGVRIDYIYYPNADNEHDGIVLRLTNENDVAVRYAFTVVFRAPEADTSAGVRGRLDPGQMKTGDSAGLFWVPFKGEDRSLGEVGLRGIEIWVIREPQSDRRDGLVSGLRNGRFHPT